MAAPKSKTICHVHDKANDWSVDYIRKNVCVDSAVEPLIEFHGNYYCLFHLPTDNKDEERFMELFRARLQKISLKFKEIEGLPDEEKLEAGKYLIYDFQFVWFNSFNNFQDFEFLGRVNFKWATFSGLKNDFTRTVFRDSAIFDNTRFLTYADFWYARFQGYTSFTNAVFEQDAMFSYVDFEGEALFEKTRFMQSALFRSTNFRDLADFSRTTINEDCLFEASLFSKGSDFSKVRLSKKKQAKFANSTFLGDTFFDRARFRNDVSFNSAIFGTDSDVFFRRAFFAGNADFQYATAEGYLRFSNLRQGKQNKFDFQEAAFEKANRVSFHTVDLRPHWFVNVDARKFSFTDIFWINRDWDFWNRNIHAELDDMAETGAAKQKKRIFEIAARQLAVNAEENNRYEEAAKFRYMAMETRRLETANKLSPSRFLIWLYKWTSGYGERWSLAAVVLFGILAFFALLYNSPFATFTESEKKPDVGVTSGYDPTVKMNNSEGMIYSLYVAALQRPEPKPADSQTRLFVILETIFAPLQAALLALAIRRKFMR